MFKKNIPNFVTLLNLLFGCFSILSILRGDIFEASIFILLAAVLDFLDGSLARLLNARSPLGKQLDSLADIVSFGVAPGFIIYSLLSHSSNLPETYQAIALIGFLIPVFSAIRLAKFNIDERQTNFFLGLPVPANAILIASFPLIFNQESPDFTWISETIFNAWFLVGFTLLSSFLLVSELKLISLKFTGNKGDTNKTKYLFVLLSLVLIIVFRFIGIPLVILLYFIFSIIDNRIKKN